jgi:LysM repeat protein
VPTAGTRHSVRPYETLEQDEALRIVIEEGVTLQRLSVRFKTTVAHVNARAKVLGVVAKRAQRLAYAERFSHSPL